MAPFGSNPKKLNEKYRGNYFENNNEFHAGTILSHLSRLNLKTSNRLNGSNIPNVPFLNVEILDLSNQGISTLPTSFRMLRKLKFLNLSGNKFERLPSCLLEGLDSLEHFDLSRNVLREFNVPKNASFYALKQLDLQDNRLISVPEWLMAWNCSPLAVLNLSNNPCLSNIIGTCLYEKFHLVSIMKRSVARTVKQLSLSNCGLTISNSLLLMAFESVEELNLSNRWDCTYGTYNYLPKFPCGSMMRMERLTALNIGNVQLTSLECSISRFSNLRVLDARSNDLYWIPESFCELTSLEICDFSNNRIFELPKNIEKLRCLRVLILACNKMSYVPDNLHKLENFEVFDLYMNELYDPPSQLAELNLTGLDLERNFFDTRSMKLKNICYASLREDYREKYGLPRRNGKNIKQRYYSSSSSTSGSSSSPHNQSFESDEIHNETVTLTGHEPQEDWGCGGEYHDEIFSDEFDADLLCPAMRRDLVWRRRPRIKNPKKHLQTQMFATMRCYNKHDNIMRADIPETRTSCTMSCDFITDDFGEFIPLGGHPHIIIFDEEARRALLTPPLVGQFDDAHED
ncbi:leucine-rich repeat and death domain-containing protein 1 [Nilaparvata lugens]|uniref:leucine-rich repeat and death domain-containing protein 1 n=1 Tax=Nilaparvata lugens TaxID=108931 RepID=UPI00193D9939|nr:leucine-rich repeat and death domain-containing protein 1 [Nilaparvata lugens]XP_022193051.2 leucine-rich repeat and death domain-containing protein 1 [Nilaparvata lugens]